MKRRTVSMSAETFARFQEHCRSIGRPMARVVEELVKVELAKSFRRSQIVSLADARAALKGLIFKHPDKSKAATPATNGNGSLEDQIRRVLGDES